MTEKIILASQSPRRRELLSMLGLKDFDIVPAENEAELSPDLPIGEAVSKVALQKALSVKEKCGGSSLILAADTVVCLDNRILEKPADKAEAAQMLRSLSGRTHTVYTGVALLKDGRQLCRYETTQVTFRPLSEAEIDAYIASGEPMDKAGAYGAQGLGCLFIRRIDGDFFNVVGLPLCLLGQMLADLGMSLIKTI